MSLSDRLASKISEALGTRVTGAQRVFGGDINQAYRVTTDAGPVFVKHHARPPRPQQQSDRGLPFFEAEAAGLQMLAQAVPTPEVLAVLDDALVLSYHAPAATTAASEVAAGRALAALHACRGQRYGLDHDNFMGALPQDNRAPSRPSFVAFFRERRLMPLAHHLAAPLRRRLETLPLERLLCEPAGPSLVHGDLWGGNLLHAEGGPRFIDPAACYGHPEQDLAMTRLFGGFSDAFYAAYREASGIRMDRDLEQRLALLQLYPLLIHVALFGGGYAAQVGAIIARFA